MPDLRPRPTPHRCPCAAPRAVLAAMATAAAVLMLALPAEPARAAAGVPTADQPETRALMERARQRIERKIWPMAIDDLNVLVKLEPANADAHNLLAFALRNTGDYTRSLTHYREALRLDPRHKSAHEYLGELYVKTGKIEDARKLLAALEKLCGGKDCEEYRDLDKAIAGAAK